MLNPDHPFVVALCADDKYAQAAAVTIASLSDHRVVGRELEIWLLSYEISSRNVNMLRAAARLSRATLHIRALDSDRLQFPVSSDYITAVTFGRLWLGDMLPPRIRRVLYLDCDLLVIGNLTELWETDLDGYLLGAVQEATTGVLGTPKTYEHPQDPHLDPEKPYFNAGVLLIDLPQWRREAVTARAADYAVQRKPPLNDQDALNAVLAGQWLEIDRQWNVTTFWFRSRSRQQRYRALLRRARVVHYVGHRKPWLRDDVWMADRWTTLWQRVSDAI